MTVTKAQKKAVHKYITTHYDICKIRFPLGTKDKINELRGNQSMNSFITEAVLEKIKNYESK